MRIFLFFLLFSAPCLAAERIVSLNLCLDQYLLASDGGRERAVAVTELSKDPALSYFYKRAEGLKTASPSAEEILPLRPDLVLVPKGAYPGLLALLEKRGIRMLEISLPETPEGAEGAIAAIEAETGGIKGFPSFKDEREKNGKTAVFLHPNGYVSGKDTYAGSVLESYGYRNMAPFGGLRLMDPEEIVRLSPDVLLIENFAYGSPSLATSKHAFFPDERKVFVPSVLTACPLPRHILRKETHAP